MSKNNKKKKNSNYQTEKREAERVAKEAEALLAKRKKLIKAIAIPAVAVVLVAAIVIGIGAGFFGWFAPRYTTTHKATIIVEDYGTIEVDLYGEEAPLAVENFAKLANDGYYDGTYFHRIMDDFMIQGGDGDGTPDGISTDALTPIKGEFSANKVYTNNVKHERGTISMARLSTSMDSATSQFFIVHKTSASNTEALDGNYAAFGMVTSGMNIVDKICKDVEEGANGAVAKADMPRILAISVKAIEE